MEVKIKHNEELVDATIEVVDGVMVVSPKEVKEDVSQFNTGDVLVCGWEDSTKTCEWVCILDGRVDKQSHTQYFLEDFCGMYTKGCNEDKEIWIEPSYSDSATYVRYATEEEKKLLFDRLAEKGYEWNVDTKELVKIKWKPKNGDIIYEVGGYVGNKDIFCPFESNYLQGCHELKYNLGRVFKTKEECQALCDRLNQAISEIKP